MDERVANGGPRSRDFPQAFPALHLTKEAPRRALVGSDGWRAWQNAREQISMMQDVPAGTCSNRAS